MPTITWLALALTVPVSACVLACAKPGEGSTAALGYRHCAPIIQALEEFRTAHQHYPASLDELSPDFLPSPALQPPRQLRRVEYSVQPSGGYILGFDYTFPGTNTCDYSSVKKSWDCAGAW
jgi:hypothetical protein